jgi:ATP-binding protein involved in chromosome partitioning
MAESRFRRAKAMLTETEVLSALRQVVDPELHRDVVALGMIKDLQIAEGHIAFTLELTTPACPFNEQIESDVRRVAGAIPGVRAADIRVTSRVWTGRQGGGGELLPGVKNVIAVASGKGGVGKSTIAVNLAVALGLAGAKVGLLDADVYGPNLPLMMAVSGTPALENSRIVPPVRHGVKVMSLGLFYAEETPLIVRGPIVAGVVKQFLTDVEWGDLDYLVVDLPPGTGDAALTLAQTIPITGIVLVTTPQAAAFRIATKSVGMFRKLDVPILGVVENMSYFLCPHCGGRTDVFDHGGGAQASRTLNVPFLGEIPLDSRIRERSDAGEPPALLSGSPVAEAFMQLAKAVAGRVTVVAHEQLKAAAPAR